MDRQEIIKRLKDVIEMLEFEESIDRAKYLDIDYECKLWTTERIENEPGIDDFKEYKYCWYGEQQPRVTRRI